VWDEEMSNKATEIWDEFRSVVMVRGNLFDTIFPPLLFVLLNFTLGFSIAVWSSLAIAAIIAVRRLIMRQSLLYVLGGLSGVILAILISHLLQRTEGFFLPNIIGGGITVLLCLVSVIFRRPLVAWTSFLARRWPLNWYWHPNVRPAYSEVTLIWAVFFGLKLGLQLSLFQNRATDLLAVIQLLTGWPATVLLLVISYLYGTWRLRNLEGPSVEEFRAHVDPPWTGQQRGF
jgi:hypothetical protein